MTSKRPPRGGPPTKLGDSVVDFRDYIPRTDAEREREYERELVRRAAEDRRRERARRLDATPDLRLTDAMRDAIVNERGLDDTATLAAARAWAATPQKPCLVLNGTTGCGKSVAAAWLLAQLGGGMWLRAEQAVRIFSASFGDQYDEQRLARDCPLLFVDDVGAEHDALRMQHVLTELLEARKSLRYRTVITSNMQRDKFEARYKSDRLWSRFAELVQWAGSTGGDLRRNKPKRT